MCHIEKTPLNDSKFRHTTAQKLILFTLPFYPSTTKTPATMSKLGASSVRSSVMTLVAQSGETTWKEAGGKKRNFIETIELQIGLKNYDPQRDKRFVSFSEHPSRVQWGVSQLS